VTRAEAEAIAAAGGEAVVAVLLEMSARIEELERWLARDSRNSSQPPSQDPPKSRAERRREAREKLKEMSKSKRKPGGQPGHEGKHRQMAPPEQLDRRTGHFPERCSCGLEPDRGRGARIIIRVSGVRVPPPASASGIICSTLEPRLPESWGSWPFPSVPNTTPPRARTRHPNRPHQDAWKRPSSSAASKLICRFKHHVRTVGGSHSPEPAS